MLDQAMANAPALRMSQLKFYLRAVANAILITRCIARKRPMPGPDVFTEGAFQSKRSPA